jgi:hypothetical protein
MERDSAYVIVIGPAIGALFGVAWGQTNGNALFGLGLGALAGVFIGWFIPAYRLRGER